MNLYVFLTVSQSRVDIIQSLKSKILNRHIIKLKTHKKVVFNQVCQLFEVFLKLTVNQDLEIYLFSSHQLLLLP